MTQLNGKFLFFIRKKFKYVYRKLFFSIVKLQIITNVAIFIFLAHKEIYEKQNNWYYRYIIYVYVVIIQSHNNYIKKLWIKIIRGKKTVWNNNTKEFFSSLFITIKLEIVKKFKIFIFHIITQFKISWCHVTRQVIKIYDKILHFKIFIFRFLYQICIVSLTTWHNLYTVLPF